MIDDSEGTECGHKGNMTHQSRHNHLLNLDGLIGRAMGDDLGLSLMVELTQRRWLIPFCPELPTMNQTHPLFYSFECDWIVKVNGGQLFASGSHLGVRSK